ncbi:spore coat associated protein CotJA [Clostridium cadaveris]|nr:spore coat associated protein CotJA [Clostridium cadaveris]NME63940.1 spore coat associated protein CotJA [Clostridium cadaveris]UFH65830.1 spore coat associated protein CotJA [Clostridium cadaveris]
MYKRENNNYGRDFIFKQRYENLLNPMIALKIGTIFKDLYRPYIGHNGES